MLALMLLQGLRVFERELSELVHGLDFVVIKVDLVAHLGFQLLPVHLAHLAELSRWLVFRCLGPHQKRDLFLKRDLLDSVLRLGHDERRLLNVRESLLPNLLFRGPLVLEESPVEPVDIDPGVKVLDRLLEERILRLLSLLDVPRALLLKHLEVNQRKTIFLPLFV